MKTNIFILLIFGLLFIWLGWSFYENALDTILFPPVTYFVDNQNFKTDKSVYKVGETVSIFSSFCANRSFSVKTTWRLFNLTVITYPEQAQHILAQGCYKNKWFPIGAIPTYSTPGVHHLEGVSEIQVNSQKKIYLNFRSQDFEVN